MASYILEKKEKKKLVREQELSTLYVKVSVQPEGLWNWRQKQGH